MSPVPEPALDRDATEAEAFDADVLEHVAAEVRRFAARELDAASIEESGSIPAHVIHAARSLGLFGLSLPSRFGGMALGLGGCARVVTELARRDRSTATMIGLHNGLGVRPLVDGGSDAMKERWLPRLASGEAIGAFAATEAGAGSDLTRLGTVATVVDGRLRIDGEKHYVTNGGLAALFTVLVSTPGLGGARARALVAIPRDTPGVSVGREEEKLGLRASSTVSVRFDGATVDLDHVLGPIGSGPEMAHRALDWGRTLMSAGCVGTAHAALAATLEHVSSRRQFGRALARFGSVRSHVASMLSTVFAMQSMVGATARAEHAVEALSRLATATKVFCSEGAFDVCDRAVQLHGALGYLEDAGIARMLRDSRVTRIFEGANDVLLVRSGVALYASGPNGSSRRLHPRHATELDLAWDGLDARLDRLLDAEREVHGIAGVRNQPLAVAIARADLALLVASVCMARRDEDAPRAEHAAHAQLVEAARALESVLRADDLGSRDDALVAQWIDPGPRPTHPEARA